MSPFREKASRRNDDRQGKPKSWSLQQFKFRRDYRKQLPEVISRFTGYRTPAASPPYAPLPFPPFSWLMKVPLKYETWLFAWIGAFGGFC